MFFLRGLAILCAIYVSVTAGAYLFQRHLLYHPFGNNPDPAFLGLVGVKELQLKTPDAESLTAWYAPPQLKERPVLFYLHGNAGALSHRANRFRLYLREGYGLFAPAYRGFAGSSGTPSERDIIADAVYAYEFLIKQGYKEEDIVVYGESLGTAVAVRVAAGRHPRALVLESPFASAVEVGAYTYPFLPVSWLMNDRFESIRHIGKVTSPLLILHGEQDDIVPARFGRQLFHAANQPKMAIFVPQATHYTLYEHGAFQHIDSFLKSLAPAAPGGAELVSAPCEPECPRQP